MTNRTIDAARTANPNLVRLTQPLLMDQSHIKRREGGEKEKREREGRGEGRGREAQVGCPDGWGSEYNCRPTSIDGNVRLAKNDKRPRNVA